MSMVDLNWKPSPQEMRKFGLSGLLCLGVVGLIFAWRGEMTLAVVIWVAGALTGALCATGKSFALPIYYLWMGIAFVMGNIVSRVLVALFFYGMITPFGLVMRLQGRDKLTLKANKDAPSYWVDASQPTDPARYKRQF